MKNIIIFCSVICLFFLLGCKSGDQPQNETNTATQITPAETSLPEPAPLTGDMVFSLNPGKTSIKWTGRKKLVDSHHYGTVVLQSGQVAVTGGMLTAGKFVIDMTTIHSTDLEGNPKYADLVGHLKSADFFEVDKYPTATLAITSVEPLEGNPDANVTVNANLTIKDITHPISFPAKVTLADKILSAQAKFTIDRTKWNVRYGSDSFFDNLGDKVIKNEIEFEVSFVADALPQ